MADVFISYSRRDKPFVEQLHARLAEHGRDVWVDWEDIPPTADWPAAIDGGIEQAVNFVFVITPDSLGSAVCARELAHASASGKRIVPLLRRETNGEVVPDELASRNWIFFRDEDSFESAFEIFLRALDTDLEWARAHTRLLVRATEWDAHGRDRSYLLRGNDLDQAERALAEGSAKEPSATPPQAEYVYASRRAASRRQRATLVAVGAALAVSLALTAFALLQRSNAVEQSQASQSRELAAQAQAALDEDPARSVALAREGVLVDRTPEAVQALRRSLVESRLRAVVRTGPGGAIVAVSDDGRLVLTGNDESGPVRLWRLPAMGATGTLRGHPVGIGGAAFSSRARVVATAGRDGFVRVFDSRRLLARLPAELGQTDEAAEPDEESALAPAIALSPDGRLLATTSSDRRLTRVWSLRPLRKRLELVADEEIVLEDVTPEFSRDGRSLLVAAPDGGARVVDTRTLRTLREVRPRGEYRRVEAAALSPDGSIVATSGEVHGTIRLTRVRDGKVVATLPVFNSAVPLFAANGRSLLVTDWASAPVVWRPQERETVSLAGHESWVNAIELSRDGSRALTAGDDGTARVWDASEGTTVAVLRGHRGPVLDAWLAEGGDRVVTAGSDGGVRVWDIARRVARFQGSDEGMSAVEFSPDGAVLAAADADGSARLWNVRTGDLVHRLDATRALSRIGPLPGADPALMNDLAFGAAGRRLVTAGDEGSLILWDVEAERPIRVLLHHGPPLNSVSVGARGRLAVTADDRGSLRLWNLHTGASVVLQRAADEYVFAGASFDREERRIAAVGPGGMVRIYDAQSRRRLFVLDPGDGYVEAFAFAPDGKQLAVATDDYVVLVFDLETRRIIAKLYDASELENVAYSPDGRFLVSTSWDSARIWDVATWEQLVRLPGYEPEDAAFSPDARSLAVVGAEGGEVLVHECPFCGSVEDVLDVADRHLASAR